MSITIESNNSSLFKPSIINVDEFSTENAVNAIKWLIEKRIINPSDVKRAVIDYDCSKGIPCSKQLLPGEIYPLVLEGRNIRIFVNGVTAGYGGVGPHGMIMILRLFEFPITFEIQNAIYEKKHNSKGEEITRVYISLSKAKY